VSNGHKKRAMGAHPRPSIDYGQRIVLHSQT